MHGVMAQLFIILLNIVLLCWMI